MTSFERAEAPAGHRPQRVPVIAESGLAEIDPWWGTIQPHELHPELPTFGELEVIAHLEAGGAIVDTRLDRYVDASGTIPGAIVIGSEEIEGHVDLLDPDAVTVLYCNGPQCGATPRAVETLLEMGRRPSSLAYYRGGIQDWICLGLPTVPATEASRPA